MHPKLRAMAFSGWLPASILAVIAAIVLDAYGTPVSETAIFGLYVAFGIAVPGMLWLRLLRGRPAHIAEDLTLGLVLGYCAEIATYVAARAVGAPLLVLLWPISTLLLFVSLPALRRHWRGSGIRAPLAWSWSIAAILGYLLVYSAGTVFASHHLTGTDTPYVDMPYQLALIGELKNHVLPRYPYVANVPLAYHWFFYAEAAATSWVTGIEPVTLLYRLSGLPMFVAFVVLTASAARRLTDLWWTGPVAVAVALFGTVGSPYQWAHSPAFDAQTLWATWISPTNLFGLAVLAAIVVALFELLQTDVGGTGATVSRRFWLVIGLLFAVAVGAKASILPILIVGLLAVVAGFAIGRRRLNWHAAVALALAAAVLVAGALLLYRGETAGAVIGFEAVSAFPVLSLVGAPEAHGIRSMVMPMAGLLVALLVWTFLWAGAYGLLARRDVLRSDPRILLLLGLCAGGLGVVTLLAYPGTNQIYYLRGAAGAFGLIVAAGIATVMPKRARYLPLAVCVGVAGMVGALALLAIRAIGPRHAPTYALVGPAGTLPAIILPALALVGVAIAAYVFLRFAAPKWPVLQGAVPLLVIAVVMGFSLPNVAILLASPVDGGQISGPAIPSAGIDSARWLRDHSDANDLVATNVHCRPPIAPSSSCDPRQFWISGYSERRILVEGWAYTARSAGPASPFWNPSLLAANDAAFTSPSAAAEATVRDTYHVRWLFADLTMANADSIAQYADLRHREGNFAVYELRRP
jgi:hypothetical protein